MEQILKQLCAEHGLTGIGVNIFRADTGPYVGVYLHWKHGEDSCSSGIGDTFEAAMGQALTVMAERRTPRAA